MLAPISYVYNYILDRGCSVEMGIINLIHMRHPIYAFKMFDPTGFHLSTVFVEA